MGLETIFSKSWHEFRKNLKLSLKISWWFCILPMLILLLVASIFFGAAFASIGSEISDANEALTPAFGSFIPFTGNVVNETGSIGVWAVAFVIIIFVLAIVFGLIFYISQLMILFISVYNDKGRMTLKQAVGGASCYFWKLLGLIFLLILIFFGVSLGFILLGVVSFLIFNGVLVLAILIEVLLFFLFFILYFYLIVRLYFSPFVLFRENTGIVEAMRRSSLIVRGRWWKTLGYIMIISLVVWAVSFVFSLVMQLISLLFFGLIFLSVLLGGAAFVLSLFFIISLVIVVFSFMFVLMGLASSLLLKNLYLEMRIGKIKK